MSKDLPLDFPILSFCGEVSAGHGEDCWTYLVAPRYVVIAVFDGCGGVGARTHEAYGGHTEAYMSARLCAGAFYESVQTNFDEFTDTERFVKEILAPNIENRLSYNLVQDEPKGIRVTGFKKLPTTMAAAFITLDKNDRAQVNPVWAGDSRVYVMDNSGLYQLSMDDSNQADPMDGIYNSGGLTNLICAESDYFLNFASFKFEYPFMIITTTDGCFDYVSTPMEFEGMILHTLLESKGVAEWKDNLRNLVCHFAGDDHSLCLASFGFNTFSELQEKFVGRYEFLKENYLEKVWKLSADDKDSRQKLWEEYKIGYMRHIEDRKKNGSYRKI